MCEVQLLPWKLTQYTSTPHWELTPQPNSRTPATALAGQDGYSKQITSMRQNCFGSHGLKKVGWLGCSNVGSGVANFYLHTSNNSDPITHHGTTKPCSLQAQVYSLGRHNKPCALYRAFHQLSLSENQH